MRRLVAVRVVSKGNSNTDAGATVGTLYAGMFG
jgi:hypothetical protein